ncbi:MAG: hypothetical protein DID89_2727548156 [Candidatus Nitrotoga sp. CP45]|nr:MAG: hypothetical protein DID89_2727548156 [Candidatus Nitrotoga sp. CP45]
MGVDENAVCGVVQTEGWTEILESKALFYENTVELFRQ